jgi:hypothetical protein
MAIDDAYCQTAEPQGTRIRLVCPVSSVPSSPTISTGTVARSGSGGNKRSSVSGSAHAPLPLAVRTAVIGSSHCAAKSRLDPELAYCARLGGPPLRGGSVPIVWNVAPQAGRSQPKIFHPPQRLIRQRNDPGSTRMGEGTHVSIVRVSVKLRGWCKVLKARIRGRTDVALAREDRATTEAVVRYLPAGAFWLDRLNSDGSRVRIIAKPDGGAVVLPPELEQDVVLRQLERGVRQPGWEQSSEPTRGA